VDLYACYYGNNNIPFIVPFCIENTTVNACPPFTERKLVQKTVITKDDFEAFNSIEIDNHLGNKTI
jgi:hypothetical protein